MTYLLLSLPFVGAALVVFAAGLACASRRWSARRLLAAWAATATALVVLTVVFDNVMIAAGLFDYGREVISGARIVLVPVEDLLYPLAASLLLSGAWELLGGTRADRGAS
ncbi:MAG: lycopene cyclase domain-containing protein [Microbacterium sp.]